MKKEPIITQLSRSHPEDLANVPYSALQDFAPGDDDKVVEWNEPEQLSNELQFVEPLPADAIHDVLRPYIYDEAERMSCPPDYIFAAMLVVLGAVVGTGCGIKPKAHDSWLVVPNLWGAIIAPPGKKKTSALRAGTKFIDEIEESNEQAFNDAEKEWRAEYAAYKAADERIKNDMKGASRPAKSRYAGSGTGEIKHDVESLKAELIALEEPPKPVRARKRTNNATVEKNHELCRDNPSGILVERDELAGFFAQMDQAGHEQDRAFYLEGWNGTGRFDLDRIGRGTVSAKTVCLSVLGGIQPDKLREHLSQKGMMQSNDGMIQRFQVVTYPDDIPYRHVDRIPDANAQSKVRHIVKVLSSNSFEGLGALKQEGSEIPFFRFSEEAQEEFNKWLINLETQKLTAKEHPMILEHLSKFRSFVPKLALLDHLLGVADGNASGPVSLESFIRGAVQAEYFEKQARRMYGILLGGLTASSKLSKRILVGDLQDGFTVRDVYRNGWTTLSSIEAVEQACEVLVSKNWIRLERAGSGIQGGRPTNVYRINPKVYQWKDISKS